MANNDNNNIQFKVPIDELDVFKCECGCEVFYPVISIRKVPALISPNGQAGMFINQEGFKCANVSCGNTYTQQIIMETDKPKIEVVK